MPDSAEPWLSVVMPTFRGERFLQCALDSILAEQDKDLEIIVVDDGSDDSTCDILSSYMSLLPLRVIRVEHCGNWVTNTNRGLAEARGRFVSLLHQDDCWLAGRCIALRSLVSRYPDVSLFVHSAMFIDDKGRQVGRWTCPLPAHGKPLDSAFVLARLIVQNFISIAAPIFRRDVAMCQGPMDEQLWFLADWEFWSRMVSAGPTVYEPEPLSCFRLHGGSQTSLRTRDLSGLREQYIAVKDRIAGRLADVSGAAVTTDKVAEFSMEVNLALAAISHHEKSGMMMVVLRGIFLGCSGWFRFLRDSRIVQRILSRMRAGLA